MMHKPKRKSLISILITVVLAISGILYLLADRYLIEHVEISNVSAYAAEVVQTATPSTTTALISTGSKLAQAAQSTATSITTSAAASAADTTTVVADDWNYQGEGMTIAIRQVVTGSGSNTLTYYVADVQISDATQLASAFAKNQFGRNIIEYTSTIAAENNAIFAINGDYYGFRSDGIIIRNGVIYRDIPARIGLAFYTDGTMKIYDETQTSAQQLLDDGVWNTLSFGPALIEDGNVITDFSTVSIDKNIGNHSIQGNNPRTGIGIIDNNHFVFVVVDGRSTGYSRGVSLEEFAQIFADLGCTNAYNIDGGGSSTMYFMGRVVNNPLGKGQERGTSDILYVGN
jgi:exopolysaccharide biosynthesis protein